jgi:short-subunit dehydrogenase
MTNLNNKVIWVTGASAGIGEALVYELIKRDVKLILSARRKEELERVKNSCPTPTHSKIHILPLDLGRPDVLKEAVSRAIHFFGHIDILVNNAGVGQRSFIAETPLDIDRQIMEVNFFGTIALTKHLLPHFIQRKQGHYVNVSSLTGKFGTPYRSSYAASKHALHGFFDALRAEHWKDNIKVTMICPGFIQTNLSAKALTGEQSPKDKTATHYLKKSPEWCARRIVRAIINQREEVYIGGKEVWAVYLKRFFPTLFSKIIRKVPVR